MSFRLIGSRQQKVTRELAAEFASMTPFSGERKLDPRKVLALEAKLKDNLFRNPDWAFVRIGNQKIRVNGQHSSNLLSDPAVSIPSWLVAKIDEWEADKPVDVAIIYAQYDNATAARSTLDLINAYASPYPELSCVCPTSKITALSGVFLAKNDGVKRHVGCDERAQYVRDCRDFIAWRDVHAKHRLLNKAGTVAAVYATYMRDRNEAANFWGLVMSESHPNNNHPSRVLARYLATQVGKPAKHGVSRSNTRENYVKCLRAWNAYRSGATTELKYSDKFPVPYVL